MFGSDMLDVAIGVAFIYLLVSLLCSAIVEAAEAILKRRARDLERGIAALLEKMSGDAALDQARHAVLTLVNAAAGDAQKARENIEFWFDMAMDRVSGGYKRRAQRALFVIGLVVAIGLNIDTVRILRDLMT